MRSKHFLQKVCHFECHNAHDALKDCTVLHQLEKIPVQKKVGPNF